MSLRNFQFSHQNPSFVATVIGLPTKLARVYFPYGSSSESGTDYSQRRRQHRPKRDCSVRASLALVPLPRG